MVMIRYDRDGGVRRRAAVAVAAALKCPSISSS
jgi:hypothetical protein